MFTVEPLWLQSLMPSSRDFQLSSGIYLETNRSAFIVFREGARIEEGGWDLLRGDSAIVSSGRELPGARSDGDTGGDEEEEVRRGVAAPVVLQPDNHS